MSTGTRIPTELSWQPDGHVSEVALGAIADGEEALVPDDARAHLAGCDACSLRLGEAALLTLRAGEMLRAVRAAEVAAPLRARRPLPVLAIAAALVVAAIGAIPLFVDLVTGLPAMTATVRRALPVLARAAVVLLRHGSSGAGRAATVVSWVAAALALVLGLAIARAARRKPSSENASVEGGV